jgi:hypothetical protein
MEKPHSADKVLKIVTFVALIASASLMLACIETNPHSTMRPVPPIIDVRNQGVTVSDGNYNISYSIKAQQSTTIDKILIKPRNISDPSSGTEVKETMVFINGTKMNTEKQLGYDLDSGSFLEVNAIIPCAKVLSNETSITIVSLEPYSYNYATTILA